MKKIFFLILAFSLTIVIAAAIAAGQTSPGQQSKNSTGIDYPNEAEEAFKEFDFKAISINPNNLTERKIKKLAANFPPSIRPRLILSGDYVKRLAQLSEPVFLFHRAIKSRTVIFSDAAPTVFTWKETFVTFSSGALDLLTDSEITALLAHEIGHLYFAEALAAARADDDDRQARIIELKCDLVSLTTLTELKMEPSSLLTAIKKMVEKREELHIGSFQPGSPTIADRAEIIKLYVSAHPENRKR